MVYTRSSRLAGLVAFVALGASADGCHDSTAPGSTGSVASSGAEAAPDAASPTATASMEASATPPGRVLDADAPTETGAVGGNEGAVPEGGGTVPPGDATGSGPAAWSCPAGPFGNPIPAGGATPVRVAGVPPSDAFNMNNGTFGIVEGPVWIGDALYVSEIGTGASPPPSRVLKITPAGAVTVAIANSGTNGLAVDKSGTLYGAVHKDGSISRFDLSTGAATPVVSTFMGARFDSPNNLAIRSDGTIYFSDPDYQAAGVRPQLKTRLYRVPPGANAATVVDANLSEPNGVTFSLDESTLFVTTPGAIYKYAVMGDGSVGASTMVTPTVSGGDGMTLDCAGNLYVATPNAVVVLNPAGAEIGRIAVSTGGGSATNVAFGGADHKTLYVTALGSGPQKALLQVTLGIPGLPY